MSKGGYTIVNQSAIYFVSFAVVDWVDVFTKKRGLDNQKIIQNFTSSKHEISGDENLVSYIRKAKLFI